MRLTSGGDSCGRGAPHSFFLVLPRRFSIPIFLLPGHLGLTRVTLAGSSTFIPSPEMSDDAPSLHALNDDVLSVVFSYLADVDAASLSSTSSVTHVVSSLDHGFKARSLRACARLGGDASLLPRLGRWEGSWRAACALLRGQWIRVRL